MQSQNFSLPPYFPRYIGCKCSTCTGNAKTCKQIKEILLKKVDIKMIEMRLDAAVVILCEESKEVMINYTYTNLGRQILILYIGAPLSLAGVSWTKNLD